MKRSVYLLAIAIITCACILIGLKIHTGFVFDSQTYSESNKKSTKTETLNNFQKIELNGEVLNAEIVSGDRYQISISSTQNTAPDFSVKNGILSISQHSKKNLWFFNFGIFSSSKVTVTVPKGTELKTVSLSTNTGDVKISGIKANSLVCKLNTGDTTLENSTFASTTIDSDTGDIKFSQTDCGNADLSTDTGDIEGSLLGTKSNYSLSLSTDIGDVTVDGNEYKHNYDSDGNGSYMLKAESDVGDIGISFAK